ncbi:hypothetical protein BgiMline_025290, partial [Biomphalaria glabrata]
VLLKLQAKQTKRDNGQFARERCLVMSTRRVTVHCRLSVLSLPLIIRSTLTSANVWTQPCMVTPTRAVSSVIKILRAPLQFCSVYRIRC